MAKNRSATRYTDNYYQAVAKRTPIAVALPLLHRAHPLHRTHPVHPLHHCTMCTTKRAAGV